MTRGHALATILTDWGIMGLVLPFILVFTITYGLLKKVQMFGDTTVGHRVNLILSFALGLTAVTIISEQSFIRVWSQAVALFAVGLFLLLVLAGFGGAQQGSRILFILFVCVVGSVILWLGARYDIFSIAGLSGEWFILGGIVLSFVLVLWFVLRTSNTTPPDTSERSQPAGSRPPTVAQ